MAKDHYLPAGFIGRFSNDPAERYRERLLWTYNARAGKTLQLRASNIGYSKGLYNLSGGRTIDKWDYEGPLNRVLDQIAAAEPVSLDDWIHIAVPFVTGLFVRGKEFNDRYESMPLIKNLMSSGTIVNPDNTNAGRALRLQRQIAPVMAARWVVLHNKGTNYPLISNDLGLVLTQNAENGEAGWAIPLDSNTVLGLFPQKFGHVARYENGTWYAAIEHLYPPESMFKGFNEQIAHASREFVFGAEEAHFAGYEQYIGKDEDQKMPIIMEGLWSQMFTGQELVAHENEWRTVAGISNRNLTPKQALEYSFSYDDLDIENKWSPPIMFLPANLTEFPSGVCFAGDDMALDLQLLDDFEKHVVFPKKQAPKRKRSLRKNKSKKKRR